MEVVYTISTTSPLCRSISIQIHLQSTFDPSFRFSARQPRDDTTLPQVDPVIFRLPSDVNQPWGFPSSPITICALPSRTRLAFVVCHGKHHNISPSTVPSRTNIAALKHGVYAILAFSPSVPSVKESPPVTLPSQPRSSIAPKASVQPVFSRAQASSLIHPLGSHSVCA